jgi:hypothetical protein
MLPLLRYIWLKACIIFKLHECSMNSYKNFYNLSIYHFDKFESIKIIIISIIIYTPKKSKSLYLVLKNVVLTLSKII